MKILLTGISGFIGFHIAEKLLQQGHTLIAPVRPNALTGVSELTRYKNLHLLNGNFYDAQLLSQIEITPEAILHFASIRGAGKQQEQLYKQVNIGGTEQLLKYAKEKAISKFIYCSSVGVLGTIPQKCPASPNDKAVADGIYHFTKYESEKMVLAANNSNLKTAVVRPTITYGPRDDGFIPKMVDMVVNRKMIIPTGQVKLHLLNVFSFAKLIAKMVERDNWQGKIYHVADKAPVILNELINYISILKSRKNYPKILKIPKFIYIGASKILNLIGMDALKTSIQLISEDWCYNIDKTISELNFEPVETLNSMEGMWNGNEGKTTQ